MLHQHFVSHLKSNVSAAVKRRPVCIRLNKQIATWCFPFWAKNSCLDGSLALALHIGFVGANTSSDVKSTFFIPKSTGSF